MTIATDAKLAQMSVNTIKFLAVDAVEKANSGHPGMPMGAADAAYVLWTRFLRYDADAPDWADRDRFVLSAGHGCMLLYALLHLSGYELSMAELQSFRQWGTRTPGHPEFGLTAGVEATTGPLGQGISNAVGMALAARMMAARFNGHGEFDPVGHRVFVLASDGDLMEGVSGEASSLAGHLALGNLVALYDDNEITIEGQTNLTWSEDVAKRYEAYGWHVQRVDGHDHDTIGAAIEAALADSGRPSLIACRTHIANGSPGKQDTADSHGAPLGAEEVAATKKAAGWPESPTFHVPDEVRAFFRSRSEEGKALRTAWEQRLGQWRAENSELSTQWDAHWNRTVPADITERLLSAAPTKAAATRAHGGTVLQEAARLVPSLVGGSADLGPSTKTVIKGLALGRKERVHRQESPLRHSRARDGRCDERNALPRIVPPVRRDVPRLCRLHASADATGCPVSPSRGLRTHARLDLRRRGRPDPRADRACLFPACDPEHACIPTRRRLRDRPGLGDGTRTERRADLAPAVATDASADRAYRDGRSCRPAPRRLPDPEYARAGSHHRGYGL